MSSKSNPKAGSDFTEPKADPPKPRRGKQAKPAGETPAECFKRVGSHRTSFAINAIEAIGKLTTSNYEYTSDQISAIETALTQAVRDACAALANGGRKSGKRFTL